MRAVGFFLITSISSLIGAAAQDGRPAIAATAQLPLSFATAANGASNTLAPRFVPAYPGTRTLNGRAADNANTATQSVAPTADSVTPNVGSGTSQSFTFNFSSVNGYGYLNRVYGLINAAQSSVNVCKVEYEPASNRLYLLNDADTAWLGPLTPGVAGTESNSQCTINAGASAVSGAGNTLSLTVAVSFTEAFAGLKNVYGYALDNGNLNSGWQTLGTWYTAALAAVAPTADSVTPNAGSGTSQSFTFKFSSVNGYAYLNRVYALINASTSSVSGCKVEYEPAGNRLYLLNDADTAWLGPLTPGVTGTESNSQCRVNAGVSSAAGSGNTLTLTVAVTLMPAFVGLKNVYGYAADNGCLNSGWQTLGTWITAAPQSVAPTADSVTPNAGVGGSQSFTFKFSSLNGYGYLSRVYGLINAALSNTSTCKVEYQQASNRLYLLNDADSAWLGPLTPGVAGTMSNSQCTVNAGASSVSGAAKTLSLKVAVSFTAAFAGLKNVYGDATDNACLNSGWQTLGTWNTAAVLAVSPTADSVTPNSGAGASQSFTFRFSSVNSYGYLNTAYLLFNAALSSINVCKLEYQQGKNRLYLLNDADTAWLGPVTPGVAGTLSNSQCTINAGASSVSDAGNTLSLTVALSFTQAFAGLQNVYGYAADNGNLNSGWQELGTWNTTAMQGVAPTAATFTYPLNRQQNIDVSKPFAWTAVSGATAYELYVGTTVGALDLFHTGKIMATSYKVPPLPSGTGVCYARIYTWFGNLDVATDISFTVPSRAYFTYPASGAAAVDVSRPFSWTPVGGAQAYEFYVGTTEGAGDILDSGQTGQTSWLAPGLPTGQTLWARIATELGGSWQYSDISFTTAAVATLIYPRNGQVDVAAARAFQWTSVAGAQAYSLSIGTMPGGSDVVDTGPIQQTSYVPTLPRAQTLYCQLGTEASGVWTYRNSVFTTAPLTTDAGTGEWAYPRKDAFNSGFQDLPGRIVNPVSVSRFYLGGNVDQVLAADVDGDGLTDFVDAEGGSAVARNKDLTTKWVSPAAGIIDIVGFYDLAGNGHGVIVAISPMVIYALSGIDGSVLWAQSVATDINCAGLKVASLRSDLAGLQIFVWPDEATNGTAYAFDKGVASGYQLWQTPTVPVTQGYPPEVAIGDVNGDGHVEIVIATYGRIMTFDGATGSNQFPGWNGEVDWIAGPGVNGRNYGTLYLTALDNSGRLGAVLIADGITLHIAVITNSSAGLSLLWDKFVEFAELDSSKCVRSTIRSVGDFFGTGRIEIAVSIFNDTGDNRWHLLVYDALAGYSNPILDLPDRFLWGVQDLGNNQGTELLASVETQRRPQPASTIEIYGVQNGTFQLAWSAPNSAFAIDPHSPEKLATNSFSANGVQEILRADPLGTGQPLFFVIQGGLWTGYAYSSGTVAAAWTGAGDTLLVGGLFDNAASPVVLTCSSAGMLTMSDSTGVLGTAASGGLDGVPLVADLDGDGGREILIAAYGQVRVLDVTSSGVITERWRRTGLGLHPENDAAGPARSHRVTRPLFLPAFDFDGNGRKEILMTDTSSGNARLRVLNGDGSERWSQIFSDLPPDGPDSGIYQWTVGRFDGTGVVDVFVAGEQGAMDTEVSHIVSGATGQLLSSPVSPYGDGFGPSYGYPVVMDVDGDGIADVILQSKDYLFDLDGTSGNLQQILNVTSGLYYHTPVLMDVDGSGNPVLLLGAGYTDMALVGLDGFSYWRKSTSAWGLWDLIGRQPGVAYANGDGVKHIGISHSNGLFECINGVTGLTEWTWQLPTLATNIATSDIAGDGNNEFVFGTLDGNVVALSAQASPAQRVLWSVNLGKSVGDVVIADVLGTGHSQVLAVAGDGYLYIIDQGN